MLLKVAAATLLLAATAGERADAAPAFSYPWCAHYMMQNGARNCGFTTFAQCMQTVTGIGGFCAANPAYVPEKHLTTKSKRSRQI